MNTLSHDKFDPDRARDYAVQARIGLAGYDACHELSACILSAALGPGGDRRILVVGAGGTAGEILTAARLEPGWRFTAVDPSEPMLALAQGNLQEAGLDGRVSWVCDQLGALPETEVFDGALMIGVLHHIPEDRDKAKLLSEVAARLVPSGSLVLAGNCRAYDSAPLLQAAWANRWRLSGATGEDVRTKLDRIKSGAVPPASEEVVAALLAEAGFAAPERFFSSLFWAAWHTRHLGSGVDDMG